MRITAVNKTKKGRLAVYVDGSFVFSVDAETLLTHRIAPNTDTDPQTLEQVRLSSEERAQKERALKLLSHKSYTKRALADKLAREGDEETAEKIADRMEELGLINDEDYAKRLCADLFHVKGYGARRVLFELTKRGIDRELAEETVAEHAPEGEDTLDSLEALILRKYARNLGDRKGIDKTVRALARLGYDYDDIRAALSRCAEQDEAYDG